METLTSPEAMDEFTLRKLGKKLVLFGIIKACSVVEKHGSCLLRSTIFPHAIFQNTNCRTQQYPTIGHWVCVFLSNDKKTFRKVFYDSLGKSYTKYNICVPLNCKIINTRRHQPNDSKLCALYCLLFITCWSLDEYSFKTFNGLLNHTLLQNNDKVVLEFYKILTHSKTQKDFLNQFNLFKKKWCKKCGVVLCSCERKNDLQ